MSPLKSCSSEFGNLIDFQNKEMVNLFIDLWDGRKSLRKDTKASGCDIVEGPWINTLGCTTSEPGLPVTCTQELLVEVSPHDVCLFLQIQKNALSHIQNTIFQQNAKKLSAN